MNDKFDEREDRGLTTSALADVGKGEAMEPAPVAATPTAVADEESTPLFSPDATRTLRSRWDEVQVGFVDEPRRCVEQADNLVAMAIKQLAESFAEERAKLEAQWDRGDDVSTEELRLALRRYRSFFNRLLTM
ncbi:hypothetical protein LPW11_07730 [Geomonas sp. RF6]|uniref:hypothetical protein n=1 Tax=Geomonas sp. RF6 TaxID=2897342 RepID=UPI001E294383|nr:hypothetical protein [Geomonas sp. RF6]UFS72072.1 hypothetical protein LPW11_07730 [Geomonas sp. RF6]